MPRSTIRCSGFAKYHHVNYRQVEENDADEFREVKARRAARGQRREKQTRRKEGGQEGRDELEAGLEEGNNLRTKECEALRSVS
jgi:hypothetical protein